MTVHITFNLVDPELDSEELEAKTQTLLRQLREFDEIEQVNRVLETNILTGTKSFGAFLSGLLTAQMAPAHVPAVVGALDSVVGDSTLEITIETDGRKITVKSRSHEELAAALQTIQMFLVGTPVQAGSGQVLSATNPIQSSSIAAAPIEIFFSYSHRDEELRDELAIHLSMLKRQRLIAAWHDREITAGSDFAGTIDAHLNSASIILLLVSASFLASDYCYELELGQAMKRHAAGQAQVIPIILKPCDWTSAPFGKLQALPKDAKPVTKWDDRDEAFLNIAQGIRVAIGRRSG